MTQTSGRFLIHVLCGFAGCFVMVLSSGCKSSEPTTTQPVVNANRSEVWIDSSAPREAKAEETFDTTQVPGRIHRAQAGDTLWSLAERYYGDGNHWRKILLANRKRLKDATELPVGMILIIP